MATEIRLNQIVKGAPPSDLKPLPTAPLASLGKSSQTDKYAPDTLLSTLPSSPPQIYLNLLILESSLRAQYLHLVGRRRLNTFFLLLLALWNGLFFYALFLRPREDGTGLGGSVYWMVETSEKLALMGGVVTVLLVWGTGQWERGIRWPRKWLGTTNRGLRGFNLRVVIIRGKLWRELLGHLSFLLPLRIFREAGGFDWHLVEHEDGTIVEEDLARGGDHIMLLLLPKSFSPEFRENWEEYRTEYWEKENERRAGLRRKLNTQRRTRAKETGGWKWWTGAWRFASHRHARRHHDLEKHPQGHSRHPHSTRHAATAVSEKETSSARGNRRRTGVDLADSTGNQSRRSSRSSTPQLELDGSVDRPMLAERVRRGSSVSSTASVRRKPPARDRRDHQHHRDSLVSSAGAAAGGGGGGGGGAGGSGLSMSPLTSSSVSADTGEDEREERRRRRREREAAREKKKQRERERDEPKGKKLDRRDRDEAGAASSGASAATTPNDEARSE
ncbi:hypothetical protein A1O3_10325 [Capronia epimyces CBS 606.96]|uniref:Spo7-like protein n=1 Tax=Capronia epimyces CBS 606.96 TaxID=1182542 RepID=W9X9M4_9EURO|nr:uncharacterized protein A1O3_10325 [Capronia epimyces CBS 606.96]EXJ77167.1 hypothetical protein A1O3_10325 [Capronia epimyces CBS 606.96]